jgi:NADPH2:quinone reductase
MPIQIECSGPGDPSVLKAAEFTPKKVEKSEVLIKQQAIGVNFLDTLMRSGKVAVSKYPIILGLEAVGTIEELGSEVDGFKLGQKVAYATAPIGAYRSHRVVDSRYIVAAPDEIDDRIIAAGFAKGLTAHYLTTRVFVVRPGIGVLVHSAGSGVGQMLASWCNKVDAFVIGTVGDDSKKEAALEAGCQYVFNYKTENWVEAVKDITKGYGLNVVYDSLGEAVFNKSLDCLMKIGVMVNYGSSSGSVNSVDLNLVRKKSLFITCPSLFDYKANRMELVLSAHQLFKGMTEGFITPKVAATFPLKEAHEAHRLIELGQHSGSVILIP